ncbi:zf-C3HC-domain-containing protein [Peniophora sp. CONT]|nr:zf-C3HC-domain-containing protein [Peniophora sp. CONT]
MDSTAAPESRPNKRKLQDAFISLDDAVASSGPPPKRQNTIKSLYSTLSKYGGIKSKDETTTASKSTDFSKAPRLAAILARTATKTRKPFAFGRRPSNIAHDYRPSSTASFLARLESYKLNTYSNKPPEIDAVAASRCGWVNDGKDRLKCGLCDASWVVVGREKMNKDAAASLVKKQQAQLVEGHKDGCPWRARQCDADVYRIQLLAPAMMAKDIKARALQLEPLLEDIEIKHPLVSSQVLSLLKVLASVKLAEFTFDMDVDEPQQLSTSPEPQPRQAAVLAALFGWSIAPAMPAPAATPSRPGTPARSRAGSVVPSAPATPRRPSHLAPHAASPAPATPPLLSRLSSRLLHTPRASAAPEQQSKMLYCAMCHRRLGLWASGASLLTPTASIPPPSSRQVDVLKEHRPYCPYVTRSANIPTFPVAVSSPPTSSSNGAAGLGSNGGLVEGWRAVLTVVLRHRSATGPRPSNDSAADVFGPTANSAHALGERDAEMVDPVQAMVADVKSKGGRELLKYVKGLLG